MKNAKIIFGIAILALVGAGYLGMQYFQNNIAEEVQSLLLQNNMSASAVNYDTFEDTLTIKDLKGKDILYKDSTVHIQNITIKSPNMQAFTDVNAPMPKVADQVHFENIKGSIMILGQANTMSVASATIKNWKQNLAAVIAIKEREGFSKEFFKAMLAAEVAYLSYTDHVLHSKDEKIDSTQSTKKAESKDISARGIAYYMIENMRTSTIDIPSGGKLDLNLDSLQVENSPMLSPELLFLLTQLDDEGLEGMSDADMKELIATALNNFMLIPKQKYTLTNLNSTYHIDNTKKDLGSIKHIEMLLDFDIAKIGNVSTKLTLDDISFDSSLLSPSPVEQVLINSIFGSSRMHFDLGLKAKLANDDTSSLSADVALAKDTKTSVELDFLLNKESYVAAVENTDNEILVDKALDDIRLSALKLRMQDKDILHNILMTFSKIQNIPAENLHAELMQQIHMALAEIAPILGQDGVTAIEQCLQAPGTLDISSQPEQALSPVAAFALSLANPSKLNIKTTCTPGKNILEAR